MNKDIDLQLFCGVDDYRPYLHTPFNVGEFTYATNAHLAVRVVKRAEFDVPQGAEDKIETALPAYFEGIDNAEYKKLPAIHLRKTDCDECCGTGFIQKYCCPECDGDGEVGLDNDYNSYTFDCKTCDGEGTVSRQVKDKCPECDGEKVVLSGKHNAANLDGGRVNMILFSKFAALPNITYAYIVDKGLYAFKFDGGEGILMTLLPRK